MRRRRWAQIKSTDEQREKITNHKFQITNIYDLEERSYQFAKRVAVFCKKLPKTAINIEYIRQLIKASSSVGANYIEANESLGKKDFLMKVKICRKEAKESAFWLRLIVDINDKNFKDEGLSLKEEATQLKKIFSSIIENSK